MLQLNKGLDPPSFALPGKPLLGGFRTPTSTLHIIVLLRDHLTFSLSSLPPKGQVTLNYFK